MRVLSKNYDVKRRIQRHKLLPRFLFSLKINRTTRKENAHIHEDGNGKILKYTKQLTFVYN